MGAAFAGGALLRLISGIVQASASDNSWRERLNLVSGRGADTLSTILVLLAVLAVVIGVARLDRALVSRACTALFVYAIGLLVLDAVDIWNVATGENARFQAAEIGQVIVTAIVLIVAAVIANSHGQAVRVLAGGYRETIDRIRYPREETP
ncbi:MAG TPA: hypothetical protein VFR41_15625 [Acidimicrobiia bacterium]|nr:hypothetical protein [Acidimicrobiia bacterium]